jgi:ankyrin repeat protein
VSAELIFDAVRSGDLDLLGNAPLSLLEAVEPRTRLTPLLLATELGDLAAVEQLLSLGVAPSQSGRRGQTPLHLAALDDQPLIARSLLRHGASPTPTDDDNTTPPLLAARAASLRVLRELEASRELWVEALTRQATAESLTTALDFLRLRPLRNQQRSTCAGLQGRGMLRKIAQLREEGASSRTQRDRDAAAAPLMGALPIIANPSPDTSDHAAIRRIADALLPLEADELEELLYQHSEHLASRAGPLWRGAWERLDMNAVSVGGFAGPPGTAGEALALVARDLRKLVMTGLDLRCVLMSSIVADGVDFSGSDLSQSLLANGLFIDACFDNTDLSGVDFSQSDLRGARFRGATLTLTDFEECDLRGADFRGAVLRGVLFPRADLHGALR